MKKIFFVILLLAITISAQDFKRYKVKSGKVVYNTTGSMTGTETLIFDNYGMLESKVTETELNMMGMKQKTNVKVIMKDKWVYSIDLTKNVANKVENPVYSMFPEGSDLNDVGKKMMKKMGGKKVGTETINGKNCEVWEVTKIGSKVWMWKSIPIKTEVNMMGMNITQTATSVDIDIDVPASEFELPAGVKIEEAKTPDLNSLMGN